jgi:hypothetical protein
VLKKKIKKISKLNKSIVVTRAAQYLKYFPRHNNNSNNNNNNYSPKLYKPFVQSRAIRIQCSRILWCHVLVEKKKKNYKITIAVAPRTSDVAYHVRVLLR